MQGKQGSRWRLSSGSSASSTSLALFTLSLPTCQLVIQAVEFVASSINCAQAARLTPNGSSNEMALEQVKSVNSACRNCTVKFTEGLFQIQGLNKNCDEFAVSFRCRTQSLCFKCNFLQAPKQKNPWLLKHVKIYQVAPATWRAGVAKSGTWHVKSPCCPSTSTTPLTIPETHHIVTMMFSIISNDKLLQKL